MRHEVNIDTLNVRSGPGTSFEILDQIERGFIVEEVGTTGWCPIMMEDGSIGWVSRVFLAPAPAAPEPAPFVPTPGFAPWFNIALQELARGVKEIPGAQDNQRIVEYHSTTTLKATDDETPWCSSFVNYCMWKAGIKGTRDARAISWLDWGKEVPIATKSEVRPGDVVIFEWDSGSHHVALFKANAANNKMIVVGGNQGDRVSEATYPWSNVMGIRRPA
jgi:uncharacterized protein (TIGR02594 family)